MRDWTDDDELLADLAQAMRPVTAHVEAVARLGRGALAWLTVDDDLRLAALRFDSSLEPVSGLRDGEAAPRVLVFSAEPLSIELELLSDRTAGQIRPPGAGQVTVERPDGDMLPVDVDDTGFFVLSPLAGATVRIRCETAWGKLITDWFAVS